MLAFDENNVLCEYEENSFIAVCSNVSVKRMNRDGAFHIVSVE